MATEPVETSKDVTRPGIPWLLRELAFGLWMQICCYVGFPALFIVVVFIWHGDAPEKAYACLALVVLALVLSSPLWLASIYRCLRHRSP